jgi:hypothetical protein
MTGKSGKVWDKADLLFLTDAHAHGMSFADLARFLNRTEHEVRDTLDALPQMQRTLTVHHWRLPRSTVSHPSAPAPATAARLQENQPAPPV